MRELREMAPEDLNREVPGLPAPGRGLRLWIGLSLAVACLIPLASCAALLPLVDNIPKWDQWSLIEVWEAHYEGRPVLPLLLKPYNGHLNILPRLVFYSLGTATRWDLWCEVLVSFLLALGTAVLLVLMLRDSGEELLLLAAPVSALVFSLGQFENYVSGYPLGQVLSQLATTWAVFALTRPRMTARHIGAGAAAAVVATFSWGAGLVAWPVGFLALVLHPRRRLLWPVLWCAVTLVCALLVRWGVGGAGQGLRPTLLALLRFDSPFFLALLGRPMAIHGFPSFNAAVGVGLLLVLGFVLALRETLQARLWLPALRWGLLGTSALAAAALITLGRSAAGPGQALASHYSTATYPLALSLVVLASQALLAWRGGAATRGRRTAAALLLAVLVCLPLGVVLMQSRETLWSLREWELISDRSDRRLLAGTITDHEIRSYLYPDPELVREGMALLRKHRLAFFADAPP